MEWEKVKQVQMQIEAPILKSFMQMYDLTEKDMDYNIPLFRNI